MIFYFSGTGNSLFAAKKLLAKEEKLINMAEAKKEKRFTYVIDEKESVGFVFPVYFYTLPSFVEDFIQKLQLVNANYIYAIITCGGGIGQAGAVLKKLLASKGYELSYVEGLLMPDNSMLFYQIPKAEEGEERIQKASDRLNIIKANIEAKKNIKIGNALWKSKLLGYAYKKCQKTKKFYAEETCISCGLCEKNCPEQMIRIENQRPVWEKEKCCKCSACINRCPVQAIQYGKGTKKRNRYVNQDAGNED